MIPKREQRLHSVSAKELGGRPGALGATRSSRMQSRKCCAFGSVPLKLSAPERLKISCNMQREPGRITESHCISRCKLLSFALYWQATSSLWRLSRSPVRPTRTSYDLVQIDYECAQSSNHFNVTLTAELFNVTLKCGQASGRAQ